MSCLLFTFGALTSVSEMAARGGAAAEIVGRVELQGYRLLFRSGLADLQQTEGRTMSGALWDVPNRMLIVLNHFERGYRTIAVTTVHEILGNVNARAYTLVNKSAQEPPSSMYESVIAAGYDRFDIPYSQLRDAVLDAQREYQDDIERICRDEFDYREP